jgi:protoporphyrinogen oxidase
LKESECYILKNALPIFEPNHLEKMEIIRDSLNNNMNNRLWVTGNYLG